MKTYTSVRLLFLLLAFLVTNNVAEARQQIGVSPSSTNDYVIPPERNTNTIRFDVTLSGSGSGSLIYRYITQLDGGNQIIKDLGTAAAGFWTTETNRYFTYGIGHGSHTISVTLQSQPGSGSWSTVSSQSTTVTLTQYHQVTVRNSFDARSVWVDNVEYPSGASFTWVKGSTHQLAASFIWLDQSNDIERQFTNWSGRSNSTNTGISVFIDQNGEYEATYDEALYPVLANDFWSETPYGTPIYANGTVIIAPNAVRILKQQGLSAGAIDQEWNGIYWTFAQWTGFNRYGQPICGSTSRTETFFPPDKYSTYRAYFNPVKPLPPTNFQAGAPVGQNVRVTWTDNPNPSVTRYDLHRRTKTDPWASVTSFGRGVQTWTDPNFTVTGTASDAFLEYRLYAYYSVNGALSDPAGTVTFATGTGFPARIADKGEERIGLAVEIPKEYVVGSYPNPFNPSTTIRYQLAEAAQVTLEIYDAIGRKVASLADEVRSAGSHLVIWNGKDSEGRQLSSGVYLYRFLAAPLSGKEAFIRSGKLVMTK